MKERTPEETEELITDLVHKVQVKNLKISIDKKATDTGKKVIAGGKQGHIKTYGSNTDKEKLWASYYEYYKNQKATNPSLSIDALTKKAATKFHVSQRTIYRVINRIENPNIMKKLKKHLPL